MYLALPVLILGSCGPPETPLAGAARRGDADEVRRLVKEGANPDERCGVNNWTPLMHAVHKEQLATSVALLKAGADADARAGGQTALIMAASYGNVEIVKALLAGGADPYLTMPDGGNALAAAIGGATDIDKFTLGQCQTETIKALLARAPDLTEGNGAWSKFARLTARASGCPEVRAGAMRQ